jgi:Icc-related predicted phosphoesterase
VRILAFSDWRIQDVDLPAAVLAEVGDVDLCLYAGDDTRRLALAPSGVDVARAAGDVGRLVGGGGQAFLWNRIGFDEVRPPGLAVYFAHVDDPALPSFLGRTARSKDGRVGAIVDSTAVLALAEARHPGAWACGIWFTTDAERDGSDVNPRSVLDTLQRAADELTPIVISFDDRPGDEPDDLLACLREMLGVTAQPRPNRLAELASHARHGLAGVIGNDCHPSDARLLHGPGLHDLHEAPLEVQGWAFMGLQGAPGRRGATTYSETAAWKHLRAQESGLSEDRHGTVVVSHAPPHGAADLAVRFGIEHIGSRSLARFASRRADLVVCGHVHRMGGVTTTLGGCTVVNTANHDRDDPGGRFALIELQAGRPPDVRWLRPDLQGIEGLGDRLLLDLRDHGVHTVTGLRTLLTTAPAGDRHRKGAVPGLGRVTGERLRRHLEAMDGRRFLLAHSQERPTPPSTPLLFLGLQHETFKANFGGPVAPPRFWCISLLTEDGDQVMYLEATGRATRPYRAEVRGAITAFLDECAALGPVTVASWGGRRGGPPAAQWILSDAASMVGMPEAADAILGMPWVDLRRLWRGSMAPPARTWKVDDLAFALGHQPDREMDGYLSGLLYDRYVSQGEEPDWAAMRRHAAWALLRIRDIHSACVAALY